MANRLIVLRKCLEGWKELEGQSYILPIGAQTLTVLDLRLVALTFGPTGRFETTEDGRALEIYEPTTQTSKHLFLLPGKQGAEQVWLSDPP